MKSKLKPPSISPSKNVIRGAALLFLLVLLGFLSLMLNNFLSTRQSDQVERSPTITFANSSDVEWTTYQDTSVGFEIKYPTQTHQLSTGDSAEAMAGINYHSEEETFFSDFMGYSPPHLASMITINELIYVNKPREQRPPTPFTLWVFSNTDNLDIDEWYQLYRYYPSIWGKAIPSVVDDERPTNNTMIANAPAQFFITQNMGTLQLIFLPVQDHMLLFEVRGDPTSDNIGNQILSTLQF